MFKYKCLGISKKNECCGNINVKRDTPNAFMTKILMFEKH
jgi:hypothetical protein